MKVSVYKEPTPRDAELCLKLEDRGNRITLMAVDPETGDALKGGYILDIREDGTLYRHTSVANSIGVSVDPACRIMLDEG